MGMTRLSGLQNSRGVMGTWHLLVTPGYQSRSGESTNNSSEREFECEYWTNREIG